MRHLIAFGLPIGAVALLLSACGDDQKSPDSVDPSDSQSGDDLATGGLDPELGKSLFDPANEADAKEDSLQAARGLPVSVDNQPTAVWEVHNQWTDTDTADARKAGMAWGANSGLDWDQKYAAWIDSMERADSTSYFKTFTMTTPYGKTLPAPALECAETAMFLRATFASWYNLPFFVEARDARGKRLYLGHFGFRTESGKYSNTPDFKTRYRDDSGQAGRWQRDGWPSDRSLRRRKLGGSQDDFQPALSEHARAGWYFDEIFLNKRVGYFMVYLLSYFGSINLADPSNLYNLQPRAVRAGDVLLERWARRGIGHTLVVKHVAQFEPDAYEVEMVSGSMPRRQGKWESASSSKSYFVNEYTGGPDVNDDGVPYAKLGGGIKRWRIAVNINGRWANTVGPNDRNNFIDASDTQTIGGRLATFDSILKEVPPEQKRQVILERVEDNRNHLRNYPASCSARIRREEAFKDLYEVETEIFGRSRQQVDSDYRILEDYALPEMVYEKSKTCCWNSSTAAMFEIIMLKAAQDTESHSQSACLLPTPFYAQNGGYQVFADFATSIGRGGEWRPWSEDETCSQRDVTDDTEEDHNWTPWCDVGHNVLSGSSGSSDGNDSYEPNNTADAAAPLPLAEHSGLMLCENDEDWYALTIGSYGTLKIDVRFSHDHGDIEVELHVTPGGVLEQSNSSYDAESFSTDVDSGTYQLRIYRTGQSDIPCQPYDLSAVLN